jgi:hypothetical protein
MSLGTKNMKTGPDAVGTAEKSPGAQNMKVGHDALGTAENVSKSAKLENGTRRRRYRRKRVRKRKTGKLDPTPSVLPKLCPGAQI